MLTDWKACKHEWGPMEDIADKEFGVVFGKMATCKKCGAIYHDDWCAARAISVERIYPPATCSSCDGTGVDDMDGDRPLICRKCNGSGHHAPPSS